MPTMTMEKLRRKPHWSFSSINVFLNVCSLQWAFKYVYGREPCFTPVALVFGGVFHQACTFFFQKRMQGEEIAPATAAELFSDLFSQACRITQPPIRFTKGQDADSLQELGGRMVLEFLKAVDPQEKVLGVAVPFTTVLKDSNGDELGKPLIGEYDLVVESNDGVVIVDWKTAARRWSEQKARTELQPTAYLLAWNQGTSPEPATFRYDIVTKTKTPAVQRIKTIRHPSDGLRLVEKIKIIEKMVRAELFLPNDQGWACSGCPYSLACEAWHRERNRSLYHFKLAA